MRCLLLMMTTIFVTARSRLVGRNDYYDKLEDYRVHLYCGEMVTRCVEF